MVEVREVEKIYYKLTICHNMLQYVTICYNMMLNVTALQQYISNMCDVQLLSMYSNANKIIGRSDLSQLLNP